MNQEPILEYESRKINKFLPGGKLQHIILFSAGALVAILTNYIGNGTYTAAEILYGELSLNTSVFNNASVIESFISVLKQDFIEIVAICLIAVACITVFSRSLVSVMLILKGFGFCRSMGTLVYICNRSDDVMLMKHPTTAFVISFISAILFNVLFIYLCDRARSFNDFVVRNRQSNEISIMLSPESSNFFITLLTVLGTSIIISILKAFLLWLTSQI